MGPKASLFSPNSHRDLLQRFCTRVALQIPSLSPRVDSPKHLLVLDWTLLLHSSKNPCCLCG
ncbi:hypothetical protein Hanom_Chr09g00795551 [Helianthus anomalus]